MKALGLLAVAAAFASCGKGDVAQPPRLTCQGCNVDLGEVRIGEDKTSHITLVNPGTAPVDITEFNEDLTPFATSLACRSRSDCRQHTIPAHQSLEVAFTFHPHDKGEVDYTIAFASSAGPISVHLRGVGVATDLLCSPTSLDFGTVLQGTSVTRTMTCENRSDLAAVLVVEPIAATLPGPRPDDGHEITASEGPLTIAPHDSAEIPVTFSPSALTEDSSSREVFGTLRIDDGAGNPVDTFLIDGTVLRRFLEVEPQTVAGYDLGFVLPGAGGATKLLFLNNPSSQAVTITALTIDSGSDPEFALSAPEPPFQVPARDAVQIELTFDPPAGDEGPRTGKLVITSDDPGEPTRSYGLSGFGGPAPDISCTWDGAPGPLDFGATPAGSPVTRDIVCTNSSGPDDPSTDLDNLQVVGLSMLVDGLSAFQPSIAGGPPPTGYTAGQSFTVAVQYSPRPNAIQEIDLVILKSNAPAHPELDIEVVGRPAP